jgi:uncharacterized protein
MENIIARLYIIFLHGVFLPGYRMMVQVQRSWFPVIDRNPQKFVPCIFKINEEDHVRSTQTIDCGDAHALYIDLPLVQH